MKPSQRFAHLISAAAHRISGGQKLHLASRYATHQQRKALATGLVALLVGLMLTAGGVLWQRGQLDDLAMVQFLQEADRIEREVQRRLVLPQYGLKGLRGVYAVSRDVKSAEFRAYVDSRDLATEFPGIRGMGFIERVQRDQLDRFVAKVRADDAPYFHVKTSGDLNDLFVIRFIEPLAQNEGAWGYDIGQETLRREGAERAMRTGQPALTAKIALVQDKEKTPGFLLYVPVYRLGADPVTPEQRQAALVGLAYTPIVAVELFRGITGKGDASAVIEIYQGPSPDESQLIYRDAQADGFKAGGEMSHHRVLRPITVAGSPMTIQIRATPAFERRRDRSTLAVAGVLGIGISFAVAFSLWLLAAGRLRAQLLAQNMTADLERMALVVQSTNNAVALQDANLRITWVNAGFTRLSGYSAEEAIGKTPGELLFSGKADAQTLQALAMSAQAGIACRVEILDRAKDGREYWLDTEVQPIHDAQKRLVGFMEIGTDITQQKLAQQRLEVALRQASAILNTVEIHAVVSVADGQGRMTDVNDAFCELSGYTREELLGQNHRIINSGYHPASFWQAMWSEIASGRPWRGDICSRAKDGSLFWSDSMIAPFVGADGFVEKYVAIRTDITERVKDQQKIAELSDRMSLAIDGGSDGFWDWMDMAQDAQWWSPNYHAMLGYTPDELTPSVSSHRAIMHPDSVAHSRAMLEHTVAGRGPYDLELQLRTKHAGYRWFRLRAKVFFDANGKATRMAGSTQDIHERKQAQDALAQSEAYLDRAGRIAGVGGWRVDLKARTIDWSRETRRIHDVDDDFVPTMEDGLSFYTPEGRSVITATVNQALQTGQGWDVELPLITRKGRAIWVRTVGEVEFENGTPVMLVGAFQDVTERHHMNEAIRKSHQLMADVLQNLPCGLSVFDGNLVLVAQNPQFRSLLGFPDSLFEGPQTTFEQVIRHNALAGEYGPGDVDTIVAAIVERARHPVAHIFERQRPNGVPLEIRGVPLPGGGFITTYVDISASKEAQRQLTEALEAARQASVSKSQFLANMSHEIRTPMNAILGLLQLLQKTELSARQQDYVQKTEGAARSLLGLLNDILDFSKVEAGKMTLDPRPFSIDKLMRDLSVIFAANVGSKDVEVLFDIDPSLPDGLVGDDMRLQQILINLGGNAIKFTSHGEVVLRLRVVEQSEQSIAVEFAVQDSGIGIAPENQSFIFSGFSQAEASTTRSFGGTGLGLAISSRLTSLMGGELKLKSALGEGSTFHFTLQFERAASEVQVGVPAQPLTLAPPSAMRILVVDDNPVARTVMEQIAQSLGWQTDVAASGAEALARVQQACSSGQPYQAIFMDWQMPEMDGWQTSQRIREALAKRASGPASTPLASGGNDLPLIMMVTAHGRETLAERSVQEQALLNGFLVKPITASMLQEAVNNARSMAAGTLPDKPAVTEKALRLRGLRILVVEDNAINRMVAQGLLKSEGALVSLAHDGQQGVAAVAAAPDGFDVILMDIQMPVMDGYTATRVLRNEMGLQLPIIAMTANAMASDRDACLAAGMDEHVGKPFEMDHLVATILRYCGQATEPTKVPVEAPGVQTDESVSQAKPNDFPPGDLDLKGATLRLGGNTALLHSILQSFADDLPHIPQRLQDQWSQGKLQDAARTLHTLKGLAATVGARHLAQLAGTQEAQCKSGLSPDGPLRLIVPLQAAVDATLQSLKTALSLHSPQADSGPVDVQPMTDDQRTTLRTSLQALKTLLDHSDMRALDACAQLRERYAAFLGAALNPLSRAMNDLEFDAASRCCESLLDSVRV